MHENKLLSLLTHPYISYKTKTPFRRSSVLLTGNRDAAGATLFFSLAHITCMTLYHTVVIKYSTSIIYREAIPRQWSPGDLLRVLRF